MSIFQIIAVFFALWMLYVVSIHRKKARLSSIEVSFWITNWTSFIIISLFPHLLLGITGVLRFSRVFDFLVVVALMILTVMVVFSYFSQKENSKKLEELVRQQALKYGSEKK